MVKLGERVVEANGASGRSPDQMAPGRQDHSSTGIRSGLDGDDEPSTRRVVVWQRLAAARRTAGGATRSAGDPAAVGDARPIESDPPIDRLAIDDDHGAPRNAEDVSQLADGVPAGGQLDRHAAGRTTHGQRGWRIVAGRGRLVHIEVAHAPPGRPPIPEAERSPPKSSASAGRVKRAVRDPVRPSVSGLRQRPGMPTTTSLRRTTAHSQLSTRLDREWDQLSRRPAVVARARSWGVTTTQFHSLDELLRLAGFKVGSSDDADEVLRRLVIVAAEDPLAARIVLQRLLPGLLAIVRREQQRDRGVDAFDLLSARLGCRSSAIGPTADLATSPPDCSTMPATGRSPRRDGDRTGRPRTSSPPARLDVPRLPQPGSTFEELTIVLGEARQAGLADDDLAIVCEYVGGRTAADLAAERKITPRTMRNRRQRALERIRLLAA